MPFQVQVAAWLNDSLAVCSIKLSVDSTRNPNNYPRSVWNFNSDLANQYDLKFY